MAWHEPCPGTQAEEAVEERGVPDEAWCPSILVVCTELSSLGFGRWGGAPWQ